MKVVPKVPSPVVFCHAGNFAHVECGTMGVIQREEFYETQPQGSFIELPNAPMVYCDAMAACRLAGCDFIAAYYVNHIDPNSREVERLVNLRLKMPVRGVVAALPYVMRLLPQGSAEEVADRMRMYLA